MNLRILPRQLPTDRQRLFIRLSCPIPILFHHQGSQGCRASSPRRADKSPGLCAQSSRRISRASCTPFAPLLRGFDRYQRSQGCEGLSLPPRHLPHPLPTRGISHTGLPRFHSCRHPEQIGRTQSLSQSSAAPFQSPPRCASYASSKLNSSVSSRAYAAGAWEVPRATGD